MVGRRHVVVVVDVCVCMCISVRFLKYFQCFLVSRFLGPSVMVNGIVTPLGSSFHVVILVFV